jgi:hypothetical protein
MNYVLFNEMVGQKNMLRAARAAPTQMDMEKTSIWYLPDPNDAKRI